MDEKKPSSPEGILRKRRTLPLILMFALVAGHCVGSDISKKRISVKRGHWRCETIANQETAFSGKLSDCSGVNLLNILNKYPEKNELSGVPDHYGTIIKKFKGRYLAFGRGRGLLMPWPPFEPLLPRCSPR